MKMCPTCKRQDVLHIGKSSAGWPFTFASDDMGDTIEDVKEKLDQGDMVDEYDRPITPDEFLTFVHTREFQGKNVGYTFHSGEFS